jgi:hypothetical protein
MRELTSRRVAPVELPGPFQPGLPPAVPIPPATAPLTGFPNLAAASISRDRPALFRQVALLGFRPSGVCSCRAAPTARHRRRALLTFLPQASRSPLQQGHPRAREPVPRMPKLSPFPSSGPSSARQSVQSRANHFHDVSIDHSPRGLPPPHGLTPVPSEAATPQPSHASRALRPCPDLAPLRPTAFRLRERPVSRETSQPSQGSSPSTGCLHVDDCPVRAFPPPPSRPPRPTAHRNGK